ncbi:MAG: SDR family NAD(P)-dependent oxidoreductase [Chitinophagales bacterium]|nr:SDR family NAD(P)-dependent oxidoreductase [Chitinophagales bacterium]MDW8427262.1 SDR family NAD(P)-dependent oxidoreductase [Chitinophagales bacterium]
MTVLVTGASGFLGLHLVRRLITKGAAVRALYHQHAPRLDPQDPAAQAQWVACNILNPDAVLEVMDGCRYCYHTAALVSFAGSWKQVYAINVQGTAHVVNAALRTGIAKLVHVSSVAAIGRGHGQEVLNEQAPWREDAFTTHYARSKRRAELEVFRGIAEGLQAVIVNPALILGPGNWHKGPPHFFLRVRRGMWFYPSGGTSMVDVDDVVSVMIALMEGPFYAERFIVSAEDLSFKTLFTTIAKLIGAPPPRVRLGRVAMECLWRLEWLRHLLTGSRPLISRETARLSCAWSRFDSSKVQRALGFQFQPIRICLERTAEAFLQAEKAGAL